MTVHVVVTSGRTCFVRLRKERLRHGTVSATEVELTGHLHVNILMLQARCARDVTDIHVTAVLRRRRAGWCGREHVGAFDVTELRANVFQQVISGCDDACALYDVHRRRTV